MHLTLYRLSTSEESTVGALYMNGEFAGWTLEDTKRIKKVAGETRVPAGLYEMKLRKEGGMHQKYRERFGRMHKGMLWLQNVPGFEWIYIHTGISAYLPKDCRSYRQRRGHKHPCRRSGIRIRFRA